MENNAGLCDFPSHIQSYESSTKDFTLLVTIQNSFELHSSTKARTVLREFSNITRSVTLVRLPIHVNSIRFS